MKILKAIQIGMKDKGIILIRIKLTYQQACRKSEYTIHMSNNTFELRVH